MTHIRPSVLSIAAIALVASQAASGQGEIGYPGGSQNAAPAFDAANGMPALSPSPAALFPGTAATSDDASAANPAADTTRMLRGNDRVIGKPKPGAGRIARGAPSSFKFEEAPIADVVNVILGEILKVEYVLHAPVIGTVTMSTRTPIAPDQAVFLLETALQANGLVLAQDTRGVYHVGKPDVLKGIVSAPRQAVNGTLPPGSGAVVVPLQFIGAAEMATILRPVVPAESLVRIDPVRNLLVLSGSRAQAEGWLDIINTFDVDLLKGMSVGLFPLKYASTGEIETMLRLLAGGVAPTGGPAGGAGGAQGSPPPGGGGAPASLGTAGAGGGAESITQVGGARIMQIQRLNSILVITPRAGFLDEARRWIDRLDKPNDNTTEPQLHVYGVQNGSARHLANVLGGIYGGSSGSGSGASTGAGIAPGLGTSQSFSSGFGGNAGGGGFGNTGGSFSSGLGSTGSSFGGGTAGGFGGGTAGSFGSATQSGATRYGQPPTGQGGQGGNPGVTSVSLGQNVRVIADEVNNALLVYSSRSEYTKIEATLKRLDVRQAQVLIEANIVEISLNDELRYGLEWAFKNNRSNGYTGTGVLSTVAGGTLGSALSGFSYTVANGMGDIRAVLNALADKSLVKVISSPSLMVLDNYTASIIVGDQQPVQTGSTITSGVGVTTSIQYKDTGVQLQVTPSVNAGNIVTMLLNQAVTDVGARDPATGQVAFKQRQISSKVAVRSGEALVLGGLIRDNTTTGRRGIPILQDLPLIGPAFGSTTVSSARTELVVILVPRVVRSDEDIRELGGDFREQMKSFSVVDILQPTGRLGAKLPGSGTTPRPND